MDCSPAADNAFGPAVKGCRDDFDFTLLFEQSIFQIAPCALLLLLLPVRASQLRTQDVKTLRTGIRTVKQAAITILAATQLALLVLWSLTPAYRTKASVPAAVLSFLACIALLFLSSAEHARSVRPSSLINGYMLLSLVLDIPQARTLWLRAGPRSVPGLFTAGLAVKATILYLEARSKRRSLFSAYRVPAPEALVNLYDRTVMWWLNPMFLQGYRSLISFDKLYALDSDLATETVEASFSKAWLARKGHGKRPLLWALMRSLKLTILSMIIPRLCLSALKLSQPLLINAVTEALSNGNISSTTQKGLGLASACLYIGIALTQALYKRQMHRFVTKIRGITISTIHATTLALPADQVADGAALTLITADVTRITTALERIDDLYASPLEAGVAIFLLERQIGIACIAPILFTVAVMIASFFNSNIAVPYQRRWLAAVQERVAYTSAMLGCPKGWKMLGLADYLTERIQALRLHELSEYADYRKFVTHRNTFSWIPGGFAPPITLMTFVLIHGSSSLTPSVAFTTLSLLALLTSPVHGIIFTIPALQGSLVSIDRIQEFLLLDRSSTVEPCSESADIRSTNSPATDGAMELSVLPKEADNKGSLRQVLTVKNVTVRIGKERKAVLEDISFSILDGSLTFILGPVGCGKSTLLKASIGECDVSSGQMRKAETMRDAAYCAQDPWLPNGTVRDLITGKFEFDETWYHAVLHACALHIDVALLPEGNDTVIGTRGVSLSGGQRQRLALARALYARKRLMVVDDALSGLDANTSKHVVDAVFGPGGICKQQSMTVILASHAVEHLQTADQIVALAANGTVAEKGTYAELNNRSGYISQLKVAAQQATQDDRKEIEQAPLLKAVQAQNPDEDEQQNLARRTGDLAVYGYYAKSLGWKCGIVIIVTALTFALGVKMPNILVQYWTQSNVDDGGDHLPRGAWIGIYFAICAVGGISVFAHIWTMLVISVPRSSAKLHEQLLHAVMQAPYSFFVNTDAGVTLNRFANDMSMIETQLAGAVMQTLDGGFLCLVGAGLIAAGSSYVGLTMPFILFVLYVLQRLYLRTSRQLRFLELEAQAPLMTHIGETTAGVTTIRAFGWQTTTHQRLQLLLDDSQRPYYLMLCIQRWLNLVLDLVTASLAIILVCMAVTLEGSSTAGSIGVSLLNILTFNFDLSYLIVAWTTLETCLGAVARCKNFESGTAREAKAGEDGSPPAQWPQTGALELCGIRASYKQDGEDVLKGISLSIKPGEKVGICGRSGSGKSSLLLTLLRLLDNSAGSITLDGIDLVTVPRQTIRSRITALPQEAITVPGSLRDNIDPLAKATDTEVEAALRRVGLLELIEQRGGSSTSMADLALSQGQMQLFAVARALLCKTKLLIVDEMTGSVDAVTEQLMMDIVTEEFKDSTIIAVAHRLKTIVGFDKIVVMDKGEIVEVGTPSELLAKEDGFFKAMWERTGH